MAKRPARKPQGRPEPAPAPTQGGARKVRPRGKERAQEEKPATKPEFVRASRLSELTDEADAFDDFTEFTDPKRRLFLQALAVTPRYGKAAKMAGISAKTAYNWRHDPDPQFQEALQVAMRLGVMRAESELWRRGIEGVEVPVFQGGRMVGTKREFSDTAAIFMLKGAEPDKYRETHRHEMTGPGGGPVQHAVITANVSIEEIQKRMATAARVIEAGKVQAPAAIEAQVVVDPDSPEARYAEELAKRRNGQ